MCVTPSFVWVLKGPKHVQQPVPCRRCWQCRSNRVSDYEGRALCEAWAATETITLTLTYAPRDDGADKILTPEHFQKFIRALRKRGHSLRYLVAGEYGDLKGRAHFHCVLFFYGKAPEMPQKQNFHLPAWPHGHVFADHNVDPRTLRYVMKYILKEEYGKHWFSLSKKPPLGAAWFEAKADECLSLGVMPSSFVYSPPGGYAGRDYLMSGATRRDFMARLVAGYAAKQAPVNPERLSEWVRNTFDKLEKEAHERAFWDLEPEEITKIICNEINKKAPSDEAVRKSLFDSSPDNEVYLDWSKIRKGWQHGKARLGKGEAGKAGGTPRSGSDYARNAALKRSH